MIEKELTVMTTQMTHMLDNSPVLIMYVIKILIFLFDLDVWNRSKLRSVHSTYSCLMIIELILEVRTE